LRPLRIATRKSPLALWQANHVAELLRARHPGVEISLLELTTEGDRFLSAPLSQIGGKGLFVKEIEQALLDGRADLAVHSLKDMTSHLPAGLCLAAVPPREDPRDAWVARTGQGLKDLPRGARVGTSSLRRSCLLLERRPDLQVVSLRGNVQTRLRKMEELELAGAVLALAGLRRLGLEGRVTEALEPEVSLPAVGQGVLAIQCRSDDRALLGMLEPLEDAATRAAVRAERAFMARLEGGCTVPLAGHARLDGAGLWLRGMVGRPDGTRVIRGERRGPVASAEQLGHELAGELLEQGGAEILRAFARGPTVPES
jgi:hydroxymethylbilane synthase